MEVKVRERVREGAVVNLFRVEGTLHGACSLSHVSHEVVALLVIKFIKVVHVLVIGYEATSSVCLLLEKEET
jgi:hypothetical protein